jgi:ATP adenylyltransferase
METSELVASRPLGGPRAAGPTCSFCECLRFDTDTREPVVVENDLFAAWVSAGALVEGHLLVLPKTHALNLREMSPATRSELPAFLALVTSRLEINYGPVAMFEHGPIEYGSAPGCSIDHAHMHVLPWTGSLVAAAQAAFTHFNWLPVRSWDDALDTPSNDPYLIVRDADGGMTLATHPEIPSQALRRVISGSLGRGNEWDWKIHPRPRTVKATVRRLVRPRL